MNRPLFRRKADNLIVFVNTSLHHLQKNIHYVSVTHLKQSCHFYIHNKTLLTRPLDTSYLMFPLFRPRTLN